jgi:Ser/Thr protein kinase RdoA (MazF antagonist)
MIVIGSPRELCHKGTGDGVFWPGFHTRLNMDAHSTDGSIAHYARLSPDTVLDAVEARGFRCDGRLLALNSYENRVYQVGLEDGGSIIAKFYRPNRWSDAQILEEHVFTQELAAAELPVAAPLAFDGATLLAHAGYRFALYPRLSGRAPELDRPEALRQLGRLLARIHNIGALEPFRHRPVLSITEFGDDAVCFLLEHGWLPVELRPAYETLTRDLLALIRARFADAGDVRALRLQGDCHAGNILWATDGPWLVDFDDARQGPAIQDLWMFLSGDREYMRARLGELLEGYSAFRGFDARELHLVEALRSLRMLHHAAWLARRWDDPAFPRAFPWFNTQHFWQEHVLSLREQLALLQEPPLEMP